jgi:type VI secretion system protein ImpE
MNAKELLDAGQLSAAIEQVNQDVRAHPTDSRQRTFLFELLCFAGDYPRAERQLDVIGQQQAAAEVGVQVYRNVLAAESARRRLFSEGLRPSFLFDPPPYVHLHLEAVNRLREGAPTEAMALLEESDSSRPHLKGRIEGQPFLDFRDGDDLLAPFLEVIVHNTYIWLPFEQIKHLTISIPKRLRDLLWIPATIESHHGPVGEVFLPVLYAGSSEHADDQVKLGRMTDWQAVAEGLAQGVGQHLFFIDGQDRGMLEVRKVEFAAESTQGAES